ncbi:MAG: hypothetical protein KC431_13150 [Myxococcales bacterium]|nr:hypothetical protein [Myxococcales bacterium]
MSDDARELGPKTLVEVEGSDQGARESQPLPSPVFAGEGVVAAAVPSLDELLEHASRVQATAIQGGTLIGECLDTHNPHLPRRILVRVHDAAGDASTAWLATLAEIRPRPGQRVLLSKPDNWPEPVVVGVIAGLVEPPPRENAVVDGDSAGPELRLSVGERLTILGPEGQRVLELRSTAEGPQIQLMQANVAVSLPGVLRLSADRIELDAKQGGVDVRTDGEAVVRARTIRLN